MKNYRPLFKKGDVVKVKRKISPFFGQVGVIVRETGWKWLVRIGEKIQVVLGREIEKVEG